MYTAHPPSSQIAILAFLAFLDCQDYRALRSDINNPSIPTVVSPSDAVCVKGATHPIGLGQGPGQGPRYADGYPVSKCSLGGGGGGANDANESSSSEAGGREGLVGEKGVEKRVDGQGLSTGALPPPGTVTFVEPRIRRYRLKVSDVILEFSCRGHGVLLCRGTSSLEASLAASREHVSDGCGTSFLICGMKLYLCISVCVKYTWKCFEMPL